MCNWGECQEIVIRQRIAVDACLAEKIVELNDLGVHTTGCCCGHGKGPGSVTILPSSMDRARELGYTVRLRPDSAPEIELPMTVQADFTEACERAGLVQPSEGLTND